MRDRERKGGQGRVGGQRKEKEKEFGGFIIFFFFFLSRTVCLLCTQGHAMSVMFVRVWMRECANCLPEPIQTVRKKKIWRETFLI